MIRTHSFQFSGFPSQPCKSNTYPKTRKEDNASRSEPPALSIVLLIYVLLVRKRRAAFALP